MVECAIILAANKILARAQIAYAARAAATAKQKTLVPEDSE